MLWIFLSSYEEGCPLRRAGWCGFESRPDQRSYFANPKSTSTDFIASYSFLRSSCMR
jgi:hypothetical protein